MKKIPSLLAVLTLSLALATRLSAAPGFRPVLQGARISGVSVSARSSDGILLATATGSSIMIWRAADGVLLNSILEHRNEVIGMGFLPGRPVLVSADRGGIVVEYDLAADALVKKLSVERMTLGFALGADGSRFALCDEYNEVGVFERSDSANGGANGAEGLATGGANDATQRKTPIEAKGLWYKDRRDNTARVNLLAFPRNSPAILAVDEKGIARWWKLGGDTEKPSLKKSFENKQCRAWLVGEGWVGTATSQGFKLFDAESGKSIRSFPIPKDRNKEADIFSAASISSDASRIAFGTEGGLFLLYSLKTGRQETSFYNGGHSYLHLRFMEERLLLSTRGEPLRVIETQGLPKRPESQEVALIPAQLTAWMPRPDALYPRCAAFSPDGRLFAVAYDGGKVRLFETGDCEPYWEFEDSNSYITAMAFDPSGDRLFTGSKWGSMTFSAYDWKKKRHLPGDRADVYNFSISPDGKLLALCTTNGGLELLDLKTRAKLKTLGPAATAAFSGDSGVLYTGSGRDVRVFLEPDWKEVITFPGMPDKVISLAVTRNGSQAYAGCANGSTVYLEPRSGQTIELPGNFRDYLAGRSLGTAAETEGAQGMTFSPDGSWFVSASNGWDLVHLPFTGGRELKLTGHRGDVRSLSASPNSRYLLSCGGDGALRVHDMRTGRSLALYAFASGDWLAIDAEGRFDGSSGVSRFINIVRGTEAFALEQFATGMNRPDLLFGELGLLEKTQTDYYKALALRREAKALGSGKRATDAAAATAKGSEAAMVPLPKARAGGAWSAESLPVVQLRASDFTKGRASVRFSLEAKAAPVVSYNVWVNGVPLFGAYGKAVASGSAEITEVFELASGDRLVELGCADASGAQSFRLALPLPALPAPDSGRTLHYLGFGVSDYASVRPRLSYAHKDALDLERAFAAMKGSSFAAVRTLTFTDAAVNSSALAKAKAFLAEAGANDAVVLFIAGHGMHDSDPARTYYFLPAAAELKDLPGSALDYSTLESLLHGIKPRAKLFLMDTCESGELPDLPGAAGVSQAAATGAVGTSGAPVAVGAVSGGAGARAGKTTLARSVRGVAIVAAAPAGSGSPTTAPETSSAASERASAAFFRGGRYINYDLEKRSGAVVLSSCKGDEASIEDSSLENGYFTESALLAFSTREADKDADQALSLQELKLWVANKVAAFSSDTQHPVVDRDNPFAELFFPAAR